MLVNGSRIALCSTVLLGALTSLVSAQQPPSKPLPALVSDLSGDVSVTVTPGGAVSKARRFDVVPVGATLEVGPLARAEIVLAGGQRFELGPKARATVAAAQLTRTSGPITELASLPALPRMVALDESGPKGPGAVVRVRGTNIAGLRPFHSVTLAERTVLRFNLVDGASRYALEIQDDAGRRIFAAESTASEVIVPAGVLAPGAAYYWTVQTLDKVSGTSRGGADFRTLSAEDSRFRQSLLRALGGEGGTDGRALQAEIDRRLGLYQEALEGFRAVLARTPDDAAIQEAVRRLEQLLDNPLPQ